MAAEGLHRSMPAVYSLMSAPAAFYAVFRYCGIEWRTRGRPRLGGRAEVSWRSALGILVLALASVAQVAVAAVESCIGGFVGSSLVWLEVSVGRGMAMVLFADGFFENHPVEHNRDFTNCISSGRLVLVDNSGFSGNLAELLKLAVRSTQTRTYVLASPLLLAAVSYYVLKE